MHSTRSQNSLFEAPGSASPSPTSTKRKAAFVKESDEEDGKIEDDELARKQAKNVEREDGRGEMLMTEGKAAIEDDLNGEEDVGGKEEMAEVSDEEMSEVVEDGEVEAKDGSEEDGEIEEDSNGEDEDEGEILGDVAVGQRRNPRAGLLDICAVAMSDIIC